MQMQMHCSVFVPLQDGNAGEEDEEGSLHTSTSVPSQLSYVKTCHRLLARQQLRSRALKTFDLGLELVRGIEMTSDAAE